VIRAESVTDAQPGANAQGADTASVVAKGTRLTAETKNWIRTRADEVAASQGCYFDSRAAERVRTFFEKFLRHSKGADAGRPFELLDWQWDRVIAPLFGWKMPDGTRRFNRAGVAIPKKNGKSTLCAGVALYLLVADGERGAEVYTAAADRKQASIIYNEAATMVEASSALSSRLKVRRASKTIRYPETNSIFEALSADVPTKDGFNISGLLFDELHTQQTRDLWNTLRYGGAARRQPLIFWITTAGIDKESLCWEQWEQALAVQENRSEDISLLGVVYAAGDNDDWKSEETWKKANPSYGITISTRSMKEACEEAISSPANENNFRRYRLNQWCGQVTRWLSVDRWRELEDHTPIEAKSKCFVGLDLSTTTDLTAMTAIFPKSSPYRIMTRFWLPESALKTRERSNRTRLDNWVRQGWIKLTKGDVIDYDVIRKDINDFGKQYKIDQILIDPWNATQLATQLQSDRHNVVFVRPTFYGVAGATKEFEKLVLEGNIRHDGNPVMQWNVANVAVESDAAGNIKPTKKNSAEKIDGVFASILALAGIIKTGEKKPSKYQTTGVQSI